MAALRMLIWASIVAGTLSGAPALAQSVTVCQGTTSCVVVSGDEARQMTSEELLRKNRSDALQHVSGIACAVAEDPERCAQLVSELYAQFR